MSGERITSKENRWVKAFRAALRSAGPAAGELLALEGPKMVEEAFRAGLAIETLLVGEAGESEAQRILQAARHNGHPDPRVVATTDKLFASLAGTQTPQGVAALVHTREWALEDLLRGPANSDGVFSGEAALIVVLVGVQDPGNVGTIVRSAEAFGASGVISTRGTADPWGQKALRASAGSALRMPLLRGMAAPMVLMQLRVSGLKILAAESRGDARAANMCDLRLPCAILIGSEGSGLPEEVRNAADGVISIPMNERVDSLNAGVAAALVLYEAVRQRRS